MDVNKDFFCHALSYGAANIVILEKQPHRAQFARTYCADYTFVNLQRTAEDDAETFHYSNRVSTHILKNVPGLNRGFDVCLEATGAEECMQMAILLCRPGGTCRSRYECSPYLSSWNKKTFK
jgi:D-xylulose reductase